MLLLVTPQWVLSLSFFVHNITSLQHIFYHAFIIQHGAQVLLIFAEVSWDSRSDTQIHILCTYVHSSTTKVQRKKESMTFHSSLTWSRGYKILARLHILGVCNFGGGVRGLTSSSFLLDHARRHHPDPPPHCLQRPKFCMLQKMTTEQQMPRTLSNPKIKS